MRMRGISLRSERILYLEMAGPSASMSVEEVAVAGGVSLNYLGKQVSNEHVRIFSEYCHPWEEIGPCLGHSDHQIAAIKENNPTAELRRRAVIQKWKEAMGFRATYRSFLKILIDFNKVQSACEICRILGDEGW